MSSPLGPNLVIIDQTTVLATEVPMKSRRTVWMNLALMDNEANHLSTK